MYWNYVLNFPSFAHTLPCFTQEVHLPRATLVVPHEAFVRQQVQAVLVIPDPLVVTGLPRRPPGVGEWSPVLDPLPLILDEEVRPAKPNSVRLVVCGKQSENYIICVAGRVPLLEEHWDLISNKPRPCVAKIK